LISSRRAVRVGRASVNVSAIIWFPVSSWK
jgi:hypothetical protein